MKSREYLLIKPRAQNRYSNYGNYSGTNTGANSSWYKPRNRERPRVAPSRPGWTNPVPSEADATPETRLPTVPQVSSVDDMDKRRSRANCGSMDHHVSACSAYKQKRKAIGYFLDDVDATDEDQEEYVRGLIMKYGPRCFFCNLEGHF